MKKVLLVVSLISVLLLAGCSKNEVNNDVNNVPEVVTNNHQEENENIMDSEQQEIIKYKLSDKYELDYAPRAELYNVGYTNEFSLDEPLKYESNGESYSIITKTTGESNLGYNRYLKLYINGKDVSPFSGIYGVGVIDLDANDNYKEILIDKENEPVWHEVYIYRINENGELSELAFDNLKSFSSIYCINDKYIFPVYLFGGISNLGSGPVIGYYTYKNGKMEYVDRLLTGEKAINENGEFVLDDVYDTMLYIIVKGDNEIEDETLWGINENENLKFKVKNFSLDNNQYDIELLDDAVWKVNRTTDFR